MKNLLLFLFIISVSCSSPGSTTENAALVQASREPDHPQIGQYVTSVFEDSNGHWWFGTLQKGMAYYDGSQLKYFTQKNGLPSNRVTGLIEDSTGLFWLKTGEGIARFDGKNFTNFRVDTDDFSNMVSQLFIDSKGIFWVGTWAGVYQFDGKEFTYFPLPYPKVTTPINKDTENWITAIREDVNGNIWFARNGYGLCKYDGKTFTHLLKKDGLHSNKVTEIEFDLDGSAWIGTRVSEKDNPDPEKRTGRGGVNKLQSDSIISFPDITGFNDGDVYSIYMDHSANIWISTAQNGVYRYDGKAFKNYAVPVSVMGMMADQKGNLWLGGAGGLYRINTAGEIINVRTNGPWK
jgi:ligand-binding sensor domain-containing protein